MKENENNLPVHQLNPMFYLKTPFSFANGCRYFLAFLAQASLISFVEAKLQLSVA
jgi:hypothetical protein